MSVCAVGIADTEAHKEGSQMHPFAVVCVGHAEDGHVGDVRVALKHLLDLAVRGRMWVRVRSIHVCVYVCV